MFSFDEDMVPEKETGNLNEGSAMLDLFCDIHSDGSFILHLFLFSFKFKNVEVQVVRINLVQVFISNFWFVVHFTIFCALFKHTLI